MDRVALDQAVEVAGFAGFGGVIAAAVLVHPMERLAGGLPGDFVAILLEQAAAHDGKGFIVAGLGYLGHRLHPAEDVFQHRHSVDAAVAARFDGGDRQGDDEDDVIAPVDRLGQVLEKGGDGVQIGIAGVADDFVHQDDARAGEPEQAVQFLAAGGGALPRGGADGFVGGLAAELPSHFAPKGVAGVAGVGAAFGGGREPGAMQYADLRRGALAGGNPGGGHNAGDFVADPGDFVPDAGVLGGVRRIEEFAGAVHQVIQGD